MNDTAEVIWQTVRDWYNSMLGLVVMNLLWALLSMTVVLLPPATAGLYAVTHSLAHGKGQHAEDFFEAARRYAGISWLWALANLLVAGIVYADVAFYATTGGVFGVLVQIALVSLGSFWLVIQFYFWPFLLEQEHKRPFLAWKNAAFLTLGAPVFTLIIVSVAALVTALSVTLILPVIIFTLSFVSFLGNRAVLNRLQAYGKRSGPDQFSSFGEPL
jgi:hypothetical protein